MALLRWILFVPAAILAMIAINFLVFIVASRFGPAIGHVTAAAFATVTLLLVGVRVAPDSGSLSKVIMVIIGAAVGLLTIAGSILGDERINLIPGVVIIVVSLLFLHPKVLRAIHGRTTTPTMIKTRRETIPASWLIKKVKASEVEDILRSKHSSKESLVWEAIMLELGERDELWEYSTPAPQGEARVESGYAIVREGKVVAAFNTLILMLAPE